MNKLPVLLVFVLSVVSCNLKPQTYIPESDFPSQINLNVQQKVHYALDRNVFIPNSQALLPASSIFSKMDLYANIETVGVVVSGTNLSKTAELMYQKNGETAWHSGHPLQRIDGKRLAGSLFGLSPATLYNIKVLDGSSEISGSITTQPNELQFIQYLRQLWSSRRLKNRVNSAQAGDLLKDVSQ